MQLLLADMVSTHRLVAIKRITPHAVAVEMPRAVILHEGPQRTLMRITLVARVVELRGSNGELFAVNSLKRDAFAGFRTHHLVYHVFLHALALNLLCEILFAHGTQYHAQPLLRKNIQRTDFL